MRRNKLKCKYIGRAIQVIVKSDKGFILTLRNKDKKWSVLVKNGVQK